MGQVALAGLTVRRFQGPIVSRASAPCGPWAFFEAFPQGCLVQNRHIVQPSPVTHISDLFILTYYDA